MRKFVREALIKLTVCSSSGGPGLLHPRVFYCMPLWHSLLMTAVVTAMVSAVRTCFTLSSSFCLNNGSAETTSLVPVGGFQCWVSSLTAVS